MADGGFGARSLAHSLLAYYGTLPSSSLRSILAPAAMNGIRLLG